MNMNVRLVRRGSICKILLTLIAFIGTTLVHFILFRQEYIMYILYIACMLNLASLIYLLFIRFIAYLFNKNYIDKLTLSGCNYVLLIDIIKVLSLILTPKFLRSKKSVTPQ